ncbi:hypothetical protein K438DRAFT_2001276 [Mycena galopus ATCC 62051]|nr:hypothetical protein K438DRAFT_2001276 [Mycena galopus ATCC 62051]
MILLAEKVECVAARIRRFRKKDVYRMQELEAACDAILKATDDSGVLPSSTYVPVNDDAEWAKTKSVMTHMPKVKMGTKRDNKDAYGSGKAMDQKRRAHLSPSVISHVPLQPVDLQPDARPPPATAPAAFSTHTISQDNGATSASTTLRFRTNGTQRINTILWASSIPSSTS